MLWPPFSLPFTLTAYFCFDINQQHLGARSRAKLQLSGAMACRMGSRHLRCGNTIITVAVSMGSTVILVKMFIYLEAVVV